MSQYRVLTPHYPFDDTLEVVEAHTATAALKYGKEKYRRPVVIDPVVPEPPPRDLMEK